MSTATVDTTLALARAEIGYVAPRGGSKFGIEYGIGSGAWCAAFVSVVLKRAGLTPGTDFPWHAWTPNGVAWGQARGRFRRSNPQRGDLVYFMWPDVSGNGRGNPPVCHVGFVEAVQADGSLITLEGNTSGTAGGSQYNGGTVQRKVRRSYIVGYVTPNYDGGWYKGPLGSRQIMPGASGEDVEAWQEWLNDNTEFEPNLVKDGHNGPLTQGRTKEYQRSVGINDDGIPGPITFGKAGIPWTGGSAPAPVPPPAPTPPPPSGPREISYGMVGQDVGANQVKLKALGFYGGKIDNHCGPLHSAAIKAFQTAAGIRSDGYWGPVSSHRGNKVPSFPGVTSRSSRKKAATLAFQRRLRALGIYRGLLDSIHGPATDAAVLTAQRQRPGLAQDRIGGPATWTGIHTR